MVKYPTDATMGTGYRASPDVVRSLETALTSAGKRAVTIFDDADPAGCPDIRHQVSHRKQAVHGKRRLPRCGEHLGHGPR